jgi:geranylgeranyl diphosphate synthase type II
MMMSGILGYLESEKQLVDKALDRLLSLPRDVPRPLAEGMRYTVLAGGKRLRPILLLTACTAAGGDPAKAMMPACAVELIHTFSLIHDDLPAMDDDDLRRGKPTLHKVIGEANAILVGDAMQALAFQVIAEDKALEPSTRVDLIAELTRAAGTNGMAAGQVVDIESENKEIDPKTMQYIHSHKTGALITASAKMGGIIAGSDDKALKALESYGERIGLAFQIVDDILDVVGSSETLGKTTGADEALKKATYPSLFGLDESRRKADACTKAAIKSLEILGTHAERLREIAEYIVKRIS